MSREMHNKSETFDFTQSLENIVLYRNNVTNKLTSTDKVLNSKCSQREAFCEKYF